MNIVVCIKQVPDTTEIKIDPVKNIDPSGCSQHYEPL